MKESYIEGLAPHDGPESCVDIREGAGEALTGGGAGRVLSREINHSRMPTLLTEAEGHMSTNDKASSGTVLRGRRPLACTDTPCARTGRSSVRPPERRAGRIGKASGRTPMMNGQRKSDRLVVPTKPPNKARSRAAEVVEGRSLAREKVGGQNTPRTQSRTKRVQCALPPTSRSRTSLTSTSEARAQCASCARWDLCGGRPESSDEGPSLPRSFLVHGFADKILLTFKVISTATHQNARENIRNLKCKMTLGVRKIEQLNFL